MIKVYEVIHRQTGLVRKVFRQRARANKYAHDLNVWLGGDPLWIVVERQYSSDKKSY